MTSASPLALKMTGVRKRYGKVVALDGLDLDAHSWPHSGRDQLPSSHTDNLGRRSDHEVPIGYGIDATEPDRALGTGRLLDEDLDLQVGDLRQSEQRYSVLAVTGDELVRIGDRDVLDAARGNGKHPGAKPTAGITLEEGDPGACGGSLRRLAAQP